MLRAVAALRTNQYVRELYLADNKMLPADGAQIALLLKSNHSIEVLDLRNNQLQARPLPLTFCPTLLLRPLAILNSFLVLVSLLAD